MSGLCSAHQGHDTECDTCNALHTLFIPAFPYMHYCVTHKLLKTDHEGDNKCDLRMLFFSHTPDWQLSP